MQQHAFYLLYNMHLYLYTSVVLFVSVSFSPLDDL